MAEFVGDTMPVPGGGLAARLDQLRRKANEASIALQRADRKRAEFALAKYRRGEEITKESAGLVSRFHRRELSKDEKSGFQKYVRGELDSLKFDRVRRNVDQLNAIVRGAQAHAITAIASGRGSARDAAVLAGSIPGVAKAGAAIAAKLLPTPVKIGLALSYSVATIANAYTRNAEDKAKAESAMFDDPTLRRLRLGGDSKTITGRIELLKRLAERGQYQSTASEGYTKKFTRGVLGFDSGRSEEAKRIQDQYIAMINERVKRGYSEYEAERVVNEIRATKNDQRDAIEKAWGLHGKKSTEFGFVRDGLRELTWWTHGDEYIENITRQESMERKLKEEKAATKASQDRAEAAQKFSADLRRSFTFHESQRKLAALTGVFMPRAAPVNRD